MKAIVIDQYGPPSVLEIRSVDRPSVQPGQVLVEVHATSVNPIDWKLRSGEISAFFELDFPMILGADIAGIVAEIGGDTSQFKVGDLVIGHAVSTTGGAYAEFIAVSETGLALKPDQQSFEEAAAMPLVGTTALQCLRDCGEVTAQSRVLIIGASGGVGTFAVQIAKALGAHVTGVCSTANLELASSLGADLVIDYTKQDVLETDVPYHMIYDTIGTQNIESVRPILSDNGVYVTLVPAEGIETFVPGETKRVAKGGYFLMCTPSAQDLEQLADWVRQGKLRSIIDSVYSLDHIQQAHERSQTLRVKGKIVIKIKE